MKELLKKWSEQYGKMAEYAFTMEVIMAIILLCIFSLIACRMPEIVEQNPRQQQEGEKNEKVKQKGITIIVDPGHGGVDPGKVGVNKVLEKDLNLAISMKLKKVLEENGYTVVMTRESDKGLYEQSDSNKKRADMKRRCDIINNQYIQDNKTINVSVHQNSYTSQSISGPQVFYYSKSEGGKKLATDIQDALNTELNIEKPRVEKANDNYYMLVHTDCPSVIVECGFLSNWNEAEKLTNEQYQEQIARAIVKGIDTNIN